MPTKDQTTSRTTLLMVLLLVAPMLLVGCAGKEEPVTVPSQTTTQVTPQLEPPPQLPPPVRRMRPTAPPSVKVIEPGETDDGELTLYEASQIAKAKKRQGTKTPIAEINDENIHEYAAQAEIILLEGEPAAEPPKLIEAPPSEPGVRDEQYWRNGALELRMGWRRTLDRIGELELESAAWRQQFYAEENPYVRDSQIKPNWDRVLDELGQLRDRAARYEQELDQFITEGQREGAQPGWLAEGIELEPEDSEVLNIEKFEVHQSMNPPVADEAEDP